MNARESTCAAALSRMVELPYGAEMEDSVNISVQKTLKRMNIF